MRYQCGDDRAAIQARQRHARHRRGRHRCRAGFRQVSLSDDFFQIIHELPRNRFLHTPSFLGMNYSDDFIVLEIAFIAGRPKETRLALLKELNARIVAGAGILPDDLMILLTDMPGENFSFGQGLAQRASISQTT
jgi:hypothetical protein